MGEECDATLGDFVEDERALDPLGAACQRLLQEHVGTLLNSRLLHLTVHAPTIRPSRARS